MELVGTHEIAAMLGGISRERVRQLYSRPDFPPPTAVLKAGRIWDRSHIETWLRETGRDAADEL